MSSLRLTVVLFLAAIFIVLVGTLAQTRDDIWKVMHDYFRVDFRELLTSTSPWFHLGQLFVWVDLDLFFPPAFFPGRAWTFPAYLGFWFPKGWLIGGLMLVNLLAAHLVRFQIVARGRRLVIGSVVVLLGILVTATVILSGSSMNGLQADPWISYHTFWWLSQTALFGLCAVSLYAAITTDARHPEQRILFSLLAVGLAALSFFAFRSDGSNEATMRILYQVLKATFAGLVLLAGCIALFKKRAGIVLLHAGIGLMMAYDVLVGVEHVESQMHIVEGETTNFSRDMRELELAVIDHSPADNDQVTVVDARLFDKTGDRIRDPRLPFDIQVLDYYANSTILGPRQPVPEGLPQENPATAGTGLQIRAVPVAKTTGTDSDSRIDVPSAYLKLTAHDGKELGTYLVSALFDLNLNDSNQPVEVDGKSYDLALRFRRLYNKYSVTLKDVQKNDYVGTDKPRDYSSYIVLNDPARGGSFEHRIWMNNPMRYDGKTYYQSNFAKLSDGGEMTTLQVVDNAGWMTPYLACMMVVVGMIYHFGQTLLRYLHRRFRTPQPLVPDSTSDSEVEPNATSSRLTRRRPASRADRFGWISACVLVLLVAGVLGSIMLPRKEKANVFHLKEFAALPMWYKGRAMPLDSFARNTLMQLSDYQSYVDADGKKQPAIRWLLNLMADENVARKERVIRIENEEVTNAIGLEPRPGFAYSINELKDSLDKIIQQAQAAGKVPADQRNLFQRRMIELANRLVFYSFLEQTLAHAPALPADNAPAETPAMTRMASRAQEYFGYLRSARNSIKNFSEEYRLGPTPLVVPTHLGTQDIKKPAIDELNSKWEPATIAHIYNQFYREFPAPTPPAIELFTAILNDYRDGDVSAFNADLDKYQILLARNASADDLPVARTDFEAWYNRTRLFDVCSWLYIAAGVFALLGWLFWPRVFERWAFALLVFIFILHTGALLGRIYISGRPPVTNLYSSAVFLGWAIVLGGLIAELLTRLGIGNVVAAVAGFLTLRIAAGLAADGDTFVVLEAVLDTQFWLATHVVCITLGYATTYLAGLFGLLYVILGVCTPRLTPTMQKELTRMMYGVLCFATFFSFWGTVLGGLWADDSWGRFWGWDPKENGALIIVLWNALVLHARWGKIVQDRGLAILAVLGNVVVSWSWFGVNELGVGLHSYGFTEGRLNMLLLFAVSQVVIACIALLPLNRWRSHPKSVELSA